MNSPDWPDIFIAASLLDFDRLLRMWPATVSGRLRPIGASAFGDIYFERPSGAIERLDVLEGGVQAVANNEAEFASLINDRTWQEEALLTQGVALLFERGATRKPDQFYGFAPHPAFTATINWESALAMDAVVWHSICSQILDVRE